jgi:DTW domain-containing protein YfiP
MNTQPPSLPPEICKTCEKPPDLCVCASISQIDNNIAVVILRHPQEQDRVLGTAKIATLQLQNSLLKTGLSWRNLDKVLGQPADPKLWGILYLGTQESAKQLPQDQPVVVLTKKGGVAEEQDEVLDQLQGIILLDGNWQQAKALWWRNAWMLKCRRIVLQPPRPSLYGNLRKEPRRESVSTIEAAAYTLAALENDPKLAERILVPFNALLEKARARGK